MTLPSAAMPAASPPTSSTLNYANILNGLGLDHHQVLMLKRASNIQFHGLAQWAPNFRDWWKPGDPANKDLLPDGVQLPGTKAHLPDGKGKFKWYDIGGMTVVTIAPENYDLAKDLATGRQIANRTARNSTAYAGGLNNPERTKQMDGVLCEMCVAQHLHLEFNIRNGLWARNQHNANRSGADLRSRNIEVRSVVSLDSHATIKAKDLVKNPTVYITMPIGREAYQVLIVGCMSAQEMWDNGDQPYWWDITKEGADPRPTWDRDKHDHAISLSALHRCPCATGTATDHQWFVAGYDNPPADHNATMKPGPLPGETPLRRQQFSLNVTCP